MGGLKGYSRNKNGENVPCTFQTHVTGAGYRFVTHGEKDATTRSGSRRRAQVQLRRDPLEARRLLPVPDRFRTRLHQSSEDLQSNRTSRLSGRVGKCRDRRVADLRPDVAMILAIVRSISSRAGSGARVDRSGPIPAAGLRRPPSASGG